MKHLILFLVTLFSSLAYAMPDWDGVYVCSADGHENRVVGFKTIDNQLHLVGLADEFNNWDDSIECETSKYEPKSAMQNAGISIESTCDANSLTKSLGIFLGKIRSNVKLQIAKVNDTSVEIVLTRTRDVGDSHNTSELIYHCHK